MWKRIFWINSIGKFYWLLDELLNTRLIWQWHPTPILLPGKSRGWRSLVGCSPWGSRSQTRLSDFTFTFHFHALEKEMATHYSVLAWRIPGTGEPGGLPSMGSHKVGHNWSDLAAVAAADLFNKNLIFNRAFYFCFLFTLKNISYNLSLNKRLIWKFSF